MPNPFADAAAGFEIPPVTIEVDRLALVKYAGASDDYVRQHWDHPFMIAQGYPDVVGHGWLSFAHMCRAVTDWAPPALATITRYVVRYHKPFHPGRLTCGGTVTAIEGDRMDASVWAKDAGGTIVASGSIGLQAVQAGARDG